MAAIFDQLQRASFAGIEFPIEEVEVSGSIRDHIHEYPHAIGGAPEKMGRRLYLIKMKANFQATFKAYPNLWPRALGALFTIFENQETDDLVVPTLGTIKAYCRNWSKQMVSRVRSGEAAQFEFVEDQSSRFLTAALISASGTASLSKLAGDFQAHRALTDFQGDDKAVSIFDGISQVANEIFTIGDQSEAFGNLVQAKFDQLANLCSQADNLSFAGNPVNWPLIDAMHALWDAAITAADNLKSQQTSPQVYIVPATQAMSQVSTTLYGNTSHTVELMQLNVVEDVFAVPAGIRLRYYPES